MLLAHLSATLAVLVFALSSPGQDRVETLLPSETTGCLVVDDLASLVESWKATELRAVADHPQMQAFQDDVRAALEQGRFAPWLMDELDSVVDRELAIALVSHDEAVAIVLVARVNDPTAAERTMNSVRARLSADGAQRRERLVGEHRVTTHTLKPSPDNDSIVTISDCVFDEWIVSSTDERVLEWIVSGAGESLAEDQGFLATAGTERMPGGLRWYIRPLRFWQAMRKLLGTKATEGEVDLPGILKREGFDAIRGIGGSLRFMEGGCDLLVNGRAFAPPPHEGSMAMLSFDNGLASELPKWLPSTATSAAVVNLDYVKAFENFGSLFDTLYGGGESGIFAEVLLALRDDVHGPRVDVRREVIENLSQPMFSITMPSDSIRDHGVIAIEVTNASAVADGFRKFFDGDDSVEPIQLGHHTLWKIQPAEELQIEGEWGFPRSAVTVANDRVLLGADVASVQALLNSASPLGGTEEYRRTMAMLHDLGGEQLSIRWFQRLDHALDLAFRQLSEHSLDEDRNSLATTIKAVVPQGVDFTKLPEFRRLRPDATPWTTGLAVRTEADGWRFWFAVPSTRR